MSHIKNFTRMGKSLKNPKATDRKYSTLYYYIGHEFRATGLIVVAMGNQFGCFVFVSVFLFSPLYFKEPVKNLGTQIPIQRLRRYT